MLSKFTFHPNLIVRTPAFPLRSQFDESDILRYLSDQHFAEALYLASPDLHEECLKWQQGRLTDPKKVEKLLSSLVKYFCRISSRCTPFGLFAGCAVANWGEENRLVLAKGQHCDGFQTRHTRLDMQYVCDLGEQLAKVPAIRDRLQYFPNTSRYQIGHEIRYIENLADGMAGVNVVSSVTASKYLLQALEVSRTGMHICEIASLLTDEEVLPEQAFQFVHELIDAQLLISELAPTVTGEGYFNHVLNVLERVQAQEAVPEAEAALRTLHLVNEHLKELDQAPGSNIEYYERITQMLGSLQIPCEKNRLFQTDMRVVLKAESLSKARQADLAEALTVLSYFSSKQVNERLEYFKIQFLERYEDQELPLLEVLDSESGLGYAGQGKEGHTPLTEDLLLTGHEPDKQLLQWGKAQQLLYGKLREALNAGSSCVEITQQDLKELTQADFQLPPSMSVIFRSLDENTLVLEGAMGTSAINLLGRFAHFDNKLDAMIKQIAEAEQLNNPGVIFAEIAHLPEKRTGNILLRPVLRGYEIPYLAQSSVPPHAQIPLQDLAISLHNNQLRLRSRRLDKTVIPRMATAHNFAYQSLPVYQFLCDLQSQGLQSGLTFSWNLVAPEAKFLPRLVYRNVILHLATWELQHQDYRELLTGQPDEFTARFQAFINTWRLPRLFTLADGDNELLVDTQNMLTVKAWVGAIRKRDKITLKEFLFNAENNSLVRDAQGRPYVNQFIAPIICTDACYPEPYVNTKPPQQVNRRDFSPGSEWLYYKFYCGVKSSDLLLTNFIKPLTEELRENKLIDKWFFVRYADPETHLRIRFHLLDVQQVGTVIQLINEQIEPFMEGKYIWKSQLETYRRELGRYGHSSMELSETLFHADSLSILNMLEQINGDEREDLRWLWGIRAIDELLNTFSYSLAEKLPLMHQMREVFALEFRMDKNLKLQLDAKYRIHKGDISRILRPTQDAENEYAYLFDSIADRNRQIKNIVKSIKGLKQRDQLEISLDDLLSSYVHMFLNRLIPANQRLHELVIYDFMLRQYQSATSINREKV